MDRDAAQQRLNRIRAFQAELAALEEQGILTLDAGERSVVAEYHHATIDDLARHFDVDRDDRQRRMSLGMRIASVLGAIALSAAVFLFFYRIWGDLPAGVQVALLVGAPLAAIGLTELAHSYDRGGDFLFIAAMIACACVVLDLVMIGDIFAIASSPGAFAVWAAFGFALGYGYRLRLPVAAGLIAALVFIAGASLAAQGIEWTAIVQRPEAFLPPAAGVAAAGAFAPRLTGTRFAATYRLVGLGVTLLVLWLLSLDAHLSALPWESTPIKAFYQVLGFVTAAAATAIGLRRTWADATYAGAASFVVFLYTKFFQWWWDWMPAYLFFLIVGVVAIGMIVLLRKLRLSGIAA